MALLQIEIQELKGRIQKALRYGHGIALAEKYQADLQERTGKEFPPTVDGLLEHIAYYEKGSEVKVEPVTVVPVVVPAPVAEVIPELEVVPEPVAEVIPEPVVVQAPVAAAGPEPEPKSKKKK